MSSFRRLSLIATVVGAILIAGSLSAGMNSTADAAPEDDIRAVVQDAVAAWNAGNVGRFLSHFTDKGISELFEGFITDRAEAEEVLAEFIGVDQITLRSVTNIRVFSGTATADVAIVEVTAIELDRWTFILRDGRWLVDATHRLDPPIPAGVRPVTVHMQEYAFVYNPAEVAGGNIAFRIHNVGIEGHELVLVRIDPGLPPLRDIVMSPEAEEGPPEGVHFVGREFLTSGQFRNMVFTQPLAPGRYGMVCFEPAPDGTPHAFLGMFSEFTVGPVTAPPVSVQPPATGDAGLAAATVGSTANLMLVLGTIMLVSGLGGIAYGRRVSVR